MKALLKVLAVLAVLGGIFVLAASLVSREKEQDYIRIYGDPVDED